MAGSPDQLILNLDFSPELHYAENLAVNASLSRLREGTIAPEEDGSLSRSVTLYHPELMRVRRLKLTGLVEIDGFVIMRGDVSRGLLVAGYQLDRFDQFQGYLPALKLPRAVNQKTFINPGQRRSAPDLRSAAWEISTARKLTPDWFDRFVTERAYLGVKI